MNLYIDIETIPADDQSIRDYIAKGVTHPGNISKPETIAKWNEESRPAAIDEAVAKTSFDGAFGRVCVIGWAINDQPAQSIFSATDEESLLLEFGSHLDQIVKRNEQLSTTVIGHNVVSFDLRFLVQRYIVNSIRPPAVILRAAQAKPWESDKVFDTMVQWAGVGSRASLDKLCFALSIKTPKGDLDGSKVAEYVAAGRIEEVADYCRGDVEATRRVYSRLTFKASQPELQFEDVPS
jgi:hypothetical protein